MLVVSALENELRVSDLVELAVDLLDSVGWCNLWKPI